MTDLRDSFRMKGKLRRNTTFASRISVSIDFSEVSKSSLERHATSISWSSDLMVAVLIHSYRRAISPKATPSGITFMFLKYLPQVNSYSTPPILNMCWLKVSDAYAEMNLAFNLCSSDMSSLTSLLKSDCILFFVCFTTIY